MNILDTAILTFILLESMNVIIMYFKPNFKYGNGPVIFKQWHESKLDEKSDLFVTYFLTWVANCKLIFIVLLGVILATTDNSTKFITVILLIPSVALFYFRLYPIIKKLDKLGQISPKGYSKTLFIMITAFICMFVAAIITAINTNLV